MNRPSSTNSSFVSPNHRAVLIVLGVIGAILMLALVAWVGKAFYRRKVTRRACRHYYPWIEHPRVDGWSWPSSRTCPPPTYEESQGSRTPLLGLLAVPQPVYSPSSSTPDTIPSSNRSTERINCTLSKVDVHRQKVIDLERQQALMCLEGSPLAGRYTSTVPDTAFRKFVLEMRLNDPNRNPEPELPPVKVPEPLTLRGGAGNKSWDISNSRFSADDMTKNIKAWILKHTNRTTTSVTVKNSEKVEQIPVTIKKRSGLWSRVTSKHLVNSAAKKQAPLNGKRITKARKETLAKLEGRR